MTSVALDSTRPTWQLAAASFVPPARRAVTHSALTAAPVLLILVVQVVLTLRLSNIVFEDEELYIVAGHEFIAQLTGGPAAPSSYGDYFSGFPMAYPVLAAALDSLGGLTLVRGASLAMMLGATLCVGVIARHLRGGARSRQAGLAAMAFFVLCGPVLFVGNFATYDAASMSLVVAAAALAVSRRTLPSAAAAGLLVALAGVTKYSGAAFIPVVVVLAALSHRPVRSAAARAALVAVTSIGTLLAVYLPSASWIGPGIELTTSDRSVLDPRSVPFLLTEYAWGLGLLTAAAVFGVVVLVRRQRTARSVLLGTALLVSGLALPISQMRLEEYISFNKHLAFAALFLAPLAGQVFAGPLLAHRSRLVKPVLLVVALYLLTVSALYRSEIMFTAWPDSRPVLEKIVAEDVSGRYLGQGASSLGYYARDRPDLTFREPYALFGAGGRAVRAAIADRTYAGVLYATGGTGNAELDASVADLADVVRSSPDYYLAGSWPKHRFDDNRFYLYLRR